MKRRIALVVTVTLFCSGLLEAHDFWLGVSAWRVAPGSRIAVTANVGDRFPNPTSYTAPERVACPRSSFPPPTRLRCEPATR